MQHNRFDFNLRCTKESVTSTLIATWECASSTTAMLNTKSCSTLCLFGTPFSLTGTVAAVLGAVRFSWLSLLGASSYTAFLGRKSSICSTKSNKLQTKQ